MPTGKWASGALLDCVHTFVSERVVSLGGTLINQNDSLISKQVEILYTL